MREFLARRPLVTVFGCLCVLGLVVCMFALVGLGRGLLIISAAVLAALWRKDEDVAGAVGTLLVVAFSITTVVAFVLAVGDALAWIMIIAAALPGMRKISYR